MRTSLKLSHMSVTFDGPRLIANARLIPTGTIAAHLDVRRIIVVDSPAGPYRFGPTSRIKAVAVVSGPLAGAEWSDDGDVLRAGARGQACGHALRPPQR